MPLKLILPGIMPDEFNRGFENASYENKERFLFL
jgi:hypothetical protein